MAAEYLPLGVNCLDPSTPRVRGCRGIAGAHRSCVCSWTALGCGSGWGRTRTARRNRRLRLRKRPLLLPGGQQARVRGEAGEGVGAEQGGRRPVGLVWRILHDHFHPEIKTQIRHSSRHSALPTQATLMEADRASSSFANTTSATWSYQGRDLSTAGFFKLPFLGSSFDCGWK